MFLTDKLIKSRIVDMKIWSKVFFSRKFLPKNNQCCASRSGSGRIRNILVGSGSDQIVRIRFRIQPKNVIKQEINLNKLNTSRYFLEKFTF